MTAPFPYTGAPSLGPLIGDALRRVVDPELALSILDVGLVYAVTVTEAKVHVLVTMTSAACPVTDLIIEDIEDELDRVVPAGMLIQVELTWEPPWTAERMSEAARCFMGG